jgi:hypothetical protein
MTHTITSSTAHAVSHKIKISFLKNSLISILYSKIFVSQVQAILDIVCIHLAQEKYKRWPLLNKVKTNLILYIFCATTLHLQYLIPTCPSMFIYSSNIFQLQFLAIFMELVLLLICAVPMSTYLVTVCTYDYNYN